MPAFPTEPPHITFEMSAVLHEMGARSIQMPRGTTFPKRPMSIGDVSGQVITSAMEGEWELEGGYKLKSTLRFLPNNFPTVADVMRMLYGEAVDIR